jgi:diaminopimelate epimerase
MLMRFTKMHGCGNAYVYVDCRAEPVEDPPGVARLVSDSCTGIGSDGLILLFPSETADARLEMYNADGSRMRMCGNGARCAGKLLLESDWGVGSMVYDSQPLPALMKQLGSPDHESGSSMLAVIMARTAETLFEQDPDELAIHKLTLQTDSGVITLYGYVFAGRVLMLTVDIGSASLRLADMECTLPGAKAIDRPVVIAGREYRLTCVSTGNPHAVVFVDDLERVVLQTEGPAIERCPIFPDRVNAHFVQVLAPTHLRMLTWERGSGATRACGTGACAAVVAATATQRSSGFCVVYQPGGSLLVDAGDSVFLTGEAHFVCSGVWRPSGEP